MFDMMKILNFFLNREPEPVDYHSETLSQKLDLIS